MKIILLYLLVLSSTYSQVDSTKNDKKFNITKCKTCEAPENILKSEYFKKYNTFDIRLSNGTYIYNVVSIARELIDTNGIPFQEFIRINYNRNDSCISEIFEATDVIEFSLGDLGSGGQPITMPIKPARFFQKKQEKITPPNHHYYLQALAGYAGTYDNPNNRDVGFDALYYGAGLKYLYGNRTKIGINAEVILENGRARMPLGLEGRFTFWGGQKVVKSNNSFFPSKCQFGTVGEKSISPNDEINSSEDFYKHQKRNISDFDETVYYTEAESIKTDPLRLFVYGEGGTFFDLFDEGQGKNPSLNPEEFGQYYYGAGLGAEFINNLDLMLGMRFMRLNLRTPCEECNNLFITNTNEAFSFLVKLSYSFNN